MLSAQRVSLAAAERRARRGWRRRAREGSSISDGPSAASESPPSSPGRRASERAEYSQDRLPRVSEKLRPIGHVGPMWSDDAGEGDAENRVMVATPSMAAPWFSQRHGGPPPARPERMRAPFKRPLPEGHCLRKEEEPPCDDWLQISAGAVFATPISLAPYDDTHDNQEEHGFRNNDEARTGFAVTDSLRTLDDVADGRVECLCKEDCICLRESESESADDDGSEDSNFYGADEFVDDHAGPVRALSDDDFLQNSAQWHGGLLDVPEEDVAVPRRQSDMMWLHGSGSCMFSEIDDNSSKRSSERMEDRPALQPPKEDDEEVDHVVHMKTLNRRFSAKIGANGQRENSWLGFDVELTDSDAEGTEVGVEKQSVPPGTPGSLITSDSKESGACEAGESPVLSKHVSAPLSDVEPEKPVIVEELKTSYQANDDSAEKSNLSVVNEPTKSSTHKSMFSILSIHQRAKKNEKMAKGTWWSRAAKKLSRNAHRRR